ncbi:MAG: universal stress protein [Chloroflexota bacterium]|nr:universal stress protein [Chloroflexota bacterium]
MSKRMYGFEQIINKLGVAAISRVEALAKSLDIELVLLHVSESVITADVPGLAAVTIPRAKEEANRMASASDYLHNCETMLREEGLSVSSELRSGSAADQIIAYAETENIDLIAMSTHGRSGIGRWVFGSVADKVLHAGNTPLMLVRI